MKTVLFVLFYHYIKPQETGNRTDVRWVSVTNDEGVGLMAKTETPIEFSALYYTAEDMSNALHSYLLEENDFEKDFIKDDIDLKI